jgi:hypothetical protein
VYLSRLARGSQEEKEACGGTRPRAQRAEVAEYDCVLERSRLGEDQEHRDQEPDVADPVVDEGFLPGARCAVALEPERHQPVGARPYAFPADEGEEEVAAEDEKQHREHEQVQIQEELRVVHVAAHVPDGVQVDERAHTRHEESHRH